MDFTTDHQQLYPRQQHQKQQRHHRWRQRLPQKVFLSSSTATTTSATSVATTAMTRARTAAAAKSSTAKPEAAAAAAAAAELDWIKDCGTGIGLVVAFSSANNCTTQSPQGRIMTAVGGFHPASAPGCNRQPPGGRDQASNLNIMAINLPGDAGGGGRTLTLDRSDFPNWERYFSAMGLMLTPMQWRSNSSMKLQQRRHCLGNSRGDGGGAT